MKTQLHKDTLKLLYTSMWLMRFLMCPLNAIDQMFSDFGDTWKNTGKKKIGANLTTQWPLMFSPIYSKQTTTAALSIKH